MNAVTGMDAQKKLRQQFADTMLDVGQVDEDMVVVVGDISHGILKPFAAACPGRYYNIGILEPTMVSLSAGLSRAGLHPVIHTIAPFLIERSFEQIKLDYCYQQLGGNIISVGSAFDYSNLGCTHHCYGDFALLKTLPGVQVVYPGTAVEFDQLFRATYDNAHVTYHRLPGTTHGVEFDANDIRFGKGIKVADGGDLTIVATGPHLRTALTLRERFAASHAIDVEVIYIHTVRPLDTEMIRASAAKTGRVVVIEEHMRSGGLGDDVLRATREISDLKFHSAAIPDRFVTGYGGYDELLESVGLTPDGIEASLIEHGLLAG